MHTARRVEPSRISTPSLLPERLHSPLNRFPIRRPHNAIRMREGVYLDASASQGAGDGYGHDLRLLGRDDHTI